MTIETFLLIQKKGEPYTVLDVRGEYEWQSGHIEGAVHIPLGQVAVDVEQSVTDKQKKLIVYCAVGGRSAQAVDILTSIGYTDVHNLEGGFSVYQMHMM
jgi:rhodanese-related sulfurtransferase